MSYDNKKPKQIELILISSDKYGHLLFSVALVGIARVPLIIFEVLVLVSGLPHWQLENFLFSSEATRVVFDGK